MPAILFGSISTLADTSELQRASFNAAFAEHGLDWTWDQESSVDMFESNGGHDRVAAYAAARGEDVDAAAVHATTSRIFTERLATDGATLRPGVAEVIEGARADGMRVGLVTTTSRANVEALAAASGLSLSDFDVVVYRSQVQAPKPDPEAYAVALRELDEKARDCVAIEDNVGGMTSANAAGIAVVAFPDTNTNTAGHSFSAAAEQSDAPDFTDVSLHVAA